MDQQQQLNNLVALFLAEAIRTRRTSLSRAAEILHRVTAGLKNWNSEEQVLAVLTNLEKDFEEVSILKQALHFGYHPSDVKVYEAEIKDYASKILSKDIGLSTRFLNEAAQSGATIQELCIKYPEFCDYLCTNSEKGELVKDFRRAPR